MSERLVTISYIIAAIFFIFSLAGLSKYETSQQGNNFGIIGMIIALISTAFGLATNNILWIILSMIIGGIIGIYLAKNVDMTKIPDLVTVLHSFVGLAAVLIGFNSYYILNKFYSMKYLTLKIYLTEIFIGVFIGAVTFIGSIVAFSKLNGRISSKPIMLPNRNKLNLTIFAIALTLLMLFIHTHSTKLQILILIIITVIALILGWYLVMSIGGADMPVAISILNSYSGWTASITGFMLNNDLLIITGAVVGSSGLVLSYIMCKAMNRSIISVIYGNLNTKNSFLSDGDKKVNEHFIEINVEETAKILKNSSSVIITPGYGMAVAQAQYSIAEMTEKLRDMGVKVLFGIHPVAGRLPGHMNVLLAEAKIPYDIMLDIDNINNYFSNTDTVLVIGANDIVNPAAQEDANSPIFGMPMLEVWKAQNVIVFKRSMNPGYAGITNSLFVRDNTKILFGDAKISINAILKLL